MSKPLPNWAMWKHVPQLSDIEAIALSLNVDPAKVEKNWNQQWVYKSSRNLTSSVPDFTERLFLWRRRFGLNSQTSLRRLVELAKAFDWSVPDELGLSADSTPVTEVAPLTAMTPPVALNHDTEGQERKSSPSTRSESTGVTRREQQIREIEKVGTLLGYDLHEVIDGGKKKIMDVCRYARPDLFGVDVHPFNDAWKEARAQERVKMANHEKFVGN